MLELLIDMGVLKSADSSTVPEAETPDTPAPASETLRPKNKVETPHGLVMNCIVR